MSVRRVLPFVLLAPISSCIADVGETGSHSVIDAPPSYDVRAQARADCNVAAGQTTTQTIGPEVPHGDQLPFDHVVLLMLENRSFDHYFRGLGRGPARLCSPSGSDCVEVPNYAGQVDVAGCDAARGHSVAQGHDCGGSTEADYNVDPSTSPPTKVHAFHETRYCTVDTAHNWEHVHRQFNLEHSDSTGDGLMDGFVASNNVYGHGTAGGGGRSMGYYDERDIPYYYWLANTFAISDRHFCSLLGPTWPNRYYYLSGTSYGRTRTPDKPVVGGRTLIDLMRQYRGQDSVEIFRDGAVSFAAGAYADTSYLGKSLWRDQNLIEDDDGVDSLTWEERVQQNRLPELSILDPSFANKPWDANDEHPPHNIQYGQQIVARVVDTLMRNPAVWQKTVLLISYDEHGGYYDHVEPPAACTPDDQAQNAEFDRLGPRVPIFAISPWTKRHYVSHTVTDLTSITRFVENRFDLPAMTRRDAAAWPLLDMFDFENPPFMQPPANPMALARIDPTEQAWCRENAPGNGVDPASAAEAGVTPAPVAPPNQCTDSQGHVMTPNDGEHEPNDGLHQVEMRGDVSSFDGSIFGFNLFGNPWTTVSATLAGSDDLDMFHWNATDTLLGENDPTIEIVDAPDGLEVCMYLACKSGTTVQGAGTPEELAQMDISEYCEGGTAKWAASGTVKGCCITSGTGDTRTRVTGYDCLGVRDDDSADLVVKVQARAPEANYTEAGQQDQADRREQSLQMCMPYEIRFHF